MKAQTVKRSARCANRHSTRISHNQTLHDIILLHCFGSVWYFMLVLLPQQHSQPQWSLRLCVWHQIFCSGPACVFCNIPHILHSCSAMFHMRILRHPAFIYCDMPVSQYRTCCLVILSIGLFAMVFYLPALSMYHNIPWQHPICMYHNILHICTAYSSSQKEGCHINRYKLCHTNRWFTRKSKSSPHIQVEIKLCLKYIARIYRHILCTPFYCLRFHMLLNCLIYVRNHRDTLLWTMINCITGPGWNISQCNFWLAFYAAN